MITKSKKNKINPYHENQRPKKKGKKMSKLKFNKQGDVISFEKGRGSFTLEAESTEFDLKRFFALTKITHFVTKYNKTIDGWEYFNNEGKRAWCTHSDLKNKLKELEGK